MEYIEPSLAQEAFDERKRIAHMRDVAAINGAVWCPKRDELCYECQQECEGDE